MSKISSALSMLFYLNNKDHYVKISELANHLEIGEREVRRYRDDLEMAGFAIENKTGLDGGYRLLHKIKFAMGLSQTETLLLNLSIRNNKDVFKALNSTLAMVSKVKQSMIVGDNDISNETLYTLYHIQNAIETKKMISISYQSPRYGEGKYQVAPYFVKRTRHKYYLYAVHQNTLKSYDVSRIMKIDETSDSYLIDPSTYEKELHETAFGVHRGDRKIAVTIEVRGTMNQYVDTYFDDRIRLVETKGNTSIYAFDTYNMHESLYSILGLASYVKILSPDELRKMYIEELGKMQNNNR